MKTALILCCACTALLSGCAAGLSPQSTQAAKDLTAATSPPAVTPTRIASTTMETWINPSPTAQQEAPTMKAEPIRITIVYDNHHFQRGLQTDWGFAALIEHQGHHVLFDTGDNGAILRMNLEALEIELESIEAVVLSHAHHDHVGGLDELLRQGLKARVFLLPSFDPSFKQRIAASVDVIEVTPGEHISPGMLSTGQMGASPPEQALILNTSQGTIIITGCAHPGIIAIIRHAVALTDQTPRLVLGGFHLRDKSQTQVEDIIHQMRQLGVQQVAPCHCTGESAIAVFGQAYQEDFHEIGVGRVLEFTP